MLELSNHLHSAAAHRAQALRLARRAAGGVSVNVAIDDLDCLGESTIDAMQSFAALRRKGVSLKVKTDAIDQGTADQVVPALLKALSAMERQKTTRQTSEAVRNAKIRGGFFGRPRVMTPERQVIAARMLAQGKRGREVLTVIRGLAGPGISQSGYYLWQKAWLARRN